MFEKIIEGVLVVSSTKLNDSVASGILFDRTYVITTGAILKESDWTWSKSFDSPGLRFPDESLTKTKFEIIAKTLEDAKNSRVKSVISTWGRLVAFCKCEDVARSLKIIFTDGTNEKSRANHFVGLKSASTFAVLKRYENETEPGVMGALSSLTKERRDVVHFLVELSESLAFPAKGQVLEVVSTPFGNDDLLNSLSRGIVCNLIGTNQCLVLTDARTVPGCEGGPIFICENSRFRNSKRRRLTGLITCSLSQRSNEWVGLTVGINLLPVLRRLLSFEPEITGLKTSLFVNETDEIFLKEVKTLDEIVVLVQCGMSWGSGIVLDGNTVITCSHVLKEDENVTVSCMKSKYDASVVYRTPDDVAYDLAVLQVKNVSFLKKMEFCRKSAQIGDEVIAAGYSSSFEKTNLKSLTLTRGCIASSHPCMIQTTCCVQSGCSGGALLKNGKLIGVIVCNLKDLVSNAVYPRVNFAIPSKVFEDIVTNYLMTKNVEVLKFLESTDNHVQTLWLLQKSRL